ncbi:hypothetical protein EV421DRAFT_1737809 [Armillaria borealis]|uniref:Uncharacterized protein n=1 Tax=Armillaria borealis TaxID=47425 RepID=A0AA39MLW6_9AGAR|nr:hypothetical protein EV421DRAFT_1737809 [Armillaria borealis]
MTPDATYTQYERYQWVVAMHAEEIMYSAFRSTFSVLCIVFVYIEMKILVSSLLLCPLLPQTQDESPPWGLYNERYWNRELPSVQFNSSSAVGPYPIPLDGNALFVPCLTVPGVILGRQAVREGFLCDVDTSKDKGGKGRDVFIYHRADV